MANTARDKVSKATGVKSTCYHMTVGKVPSRARLLVFELCANQSLRLHRSVGRKLLTRLTVDLALTLTLP
jgi:hypothetical protein